MTADAARHLVADVMRRIYERGLTTCSGGNVSLRLPNNRFAITPAATDKGAITAADVCIIDADGNLSAADLAPNARPAPRPSSEFRMHTAIYLRSPQINAIVHAHPVHASLFTTTPATIQTDLLAESWYFLQHPVKVPYFRTATDALADACAEASQQAVCLLLENHGVTIMGATMLEAFDRLELIEAAARMTLLSPQLTQPPTPLSNAQKDELDALRARQTAPQETPS